MASWGRQACPQSSLAQALVSQAPARGLLSGGSPPPLLLSAPRGQGCRPLSSSRSSLGSAEARMAGDPQPGPPFPGPATSSWGSGPCQLPSPAVWSSPWNLHPPCLWMGSEASLAQAVKTFSLVTGPAPQQVQRAVEGMAVHQVNPGSAPEHHHSQLGSFSEPRSPHRHRPAFSPSTGLLCGVAWG